MSRDDYVQQGKQFANDLRDTASKKVADNEDSILGAVGKATLAPGVRLDEAMPM